MIIHVLDETQTAINIIDSYFSYIWTEKYGECGTFELYLPLGYINNDILSNGMYLYSEEMRNSTLMVIEDIQINAKTDGDQMVLTGRSLESLLDRRICWEEPTIYDTAYETIKELLNNNVINPSDYKRAIPNFIFETSNDQTVLSATPPYLEDQTLQGANLYSLITEICGYANLGFRVKPTFDGGFIFSLYAGKRRTADQSSYQPVIFSTKLETLLGSDYFKSTRETKNSVLVWGPLQEIYEDKDYIDENGNSWTETVLVESIQHQFEGGDASGLDRREGFIEAGEISLPDEDADSEDADELKKAYQQAYMEYKAEEFLDEYNKPIITFDGELNTHDQYQFKKDYDIGDIVEVINDYNVRCVCRITEVVYSYSDEGRTILPTFTNVEDSQEVETKKKRG